MQDETRQVLEMVANGTVTPQQAEELLEALDDKPAPTPVHARPHNHTHRRRHERERRISNPALAELAQAAMHGVDADYIRQMHELGFTDVSLEELTQLAIHGVDPEFVGEMRNLGFTDL